MSLNNIGNGEKGLDKQIVDLSQGSDNKKELSSQEKGDKMLAEELDRIRTLAIQEKIEQGIPVDFTPDRFEFNTLVNMEPNRQLVSNPIYISGINVPVVMKIEEGTIIQNGVDTGKNHILVQNGDKIELKVSSPELYGKEKSVTVDIGGQTGNFSVFTQAD